MLPLHHHAPLCAQTKSIRNYHLFLNKHQTPFGWANGASFQCITTEGHFRSDRLYCLTQMSLTNRMEHLKHDRCKMRGGGGIEEAGRGGGAILKENSP